MTTKIITGTTLTMGYVLSASYSALSITATGAIESLAGAGGLGLLSAHGASVINSEVKGKSMLAMSRDLGLSYKAAFVLCHKMREAMVNHGEAYSLDGACTNWAEEFFSRMRRAEIGHHHHISGVYLLRYAQEAAWREDSRRVANGEQVQRVAGLPRHAKRSVDICGYWQRHKAA